MSPCLFNFYAEDIRQNARLDKLQARIHISRRSVNNLRYVDYTTLMAESEEELKSFLMRMKEENENAVFKLNIKKTTTTMIMTSGSHHFMANRMRKSEISDRFYFLGLKNHC